jgi:hypothetical protein
MMAVFMGAIVIKAVNRMKALWLLMPILIVIGLWMNLSRTRYSYPRSESDYYMPDPLLGHRHRPHARREFTWPEHPSGRIVMQTNNLGLRRDQDVRDERQPGVTRILVTGDSHMDGVVYNHESFCSNLESLLNRDPAAKCRFEVLNAAAGYYGPDNYRSSLDSYDSLGFEVLIVGLYTGNDFLDAAKSVEQSLPNRLTRPSGYISALRRADKIHAGAVAQLLNQEYYFKAFPEVQKAVLGKLENLFIEMNETARRKGKLFYLMLIPTKQDVELQRHHPGWAQAIRELGIRGDEVQSTSRMRSTLRQNLKRAGIEVFDPTEAMKSRPEELFWNKDYHLNISGHSLLAHLFYDEFGEKLRANSPVMSLHTGPSTPQ